MGSARGNLDPREGQQPFRPNPKRGRGPHHHVEAAVDWCRKSPCRYGSVNIDEKQFDKYNFLGFTRTDAIVILWLPEMNAFKQYLDLMPDIESYNCGGLVRPVPQKKSLLCFSFLSTDFLDSSKRRRSYLYGSFDAAALQYWMKSWHNVHVPTYFSKKNLKPLPYAYILCFCFAVVCEDTRQNK